MTPPSLRRAGLRILLGAGILWIGVLHAILLWARIEDGSILRPDVAARWLGAAAIVGLIGAIARFRNSFRFGRVSLVAVWVVAALLHAAIPAQSRLIDTADEWLAVAQNVIASAVALSLLLVAIGAPARVTRTTSLVPRSTQPLRLQITPGSFSPRAPPVL